MMNISHYHAYDASNDDSSNGYEALTTVDLLKLLNELSDAVSPSLCS
jgi:hypothetical protein